jgi:lipopolysaccharide transport system permease protein
MQQYSISPKEIVKSFWRNRSLINTLIRREVVGRYRGSVMGLLWSFFNPLLMLTVYTFVFSVVFKARWASGSESKTEFALVLFSGLMVFNLFSECINRAPSLIVSNSNYVKKVVFPLEILPIVALGSATFHLLINLLVWLVFYLLFFGIPHIAILQLPVVLIPLGMITLGLSWLLASIGVYLRDISQITGVVTTVLMFLSPIFYPIVALPIEYRAFMQISPLTIVIEQTRDLMIWGKSLDWVTWGLYFIISLIVASIGLAWFQKTRKGFADVL